MKISVFGFVVAVTLILTVGILLGCSQGVHAGQPHMQAALDSLMNAEHELNVAEEDKGGHRVAALRATRDAIHETRAGIEFARNH